MSQERLYKVLLGPVVSEKAANAGDASNQVVFKVLRNGTKQEVKAAVEKLFNVKVEEAKLLRRGILPGRKVFEVGGRVESLYNGEHQGGMRCN